MNTANRSVQKVIQYARCLSGISAMAPTVGGGDPAPRVKGEIGDNSNLYL